MTRTHRNPEWLLRLTVGLGVLFLALAVLTGCTGTKAVSFEDMVHDTIQGNRAVLVVTTSLLQVDAITPAQARTIASYTDQVDGLLKAAVSFKAIGDAVKATSLLSTATSTLTTLQSCTAGQKLRESLDACLKPLELQPQ